MQPTQINKTFNLEKVSNEFYLHYKNTNDRVKHIYFAIERFGFSKVPLLPTDNMPLEIEDSKNPNSDSAHLSLSKDWLFKSACEDLISGLTKSIFEAYRYVSFYHLANTEPLKNVIEFNKYENKIEKKIQRAGIPELLATIEEILSKSLPLKSELLSINKLRNCLVHRDGLVTQQDCNHDDKLIVKWRPIENFVMQDGQMIKFDLRKREKGMTTDRFEARLGSTSRKYEIGERISVELNEYNGFAQTLLIFVRELYGILPRTK